MEKKPQGAEVMSQIASELKYSDLRSLCKDKLEGLEHWLRRLINETLSKEYKDYFNHIDTAGNRLIPSRLMQKAIEKRSAEPERYPRLIDTLLLSDAIAIICKPELWKRHFQAPLNQAFPDGLNEAKTFLNRLLAPRNNLAHANAISVRQAEQIICYSNDVIDSIKSYYRDAGMSNDYNVPLILKLSDSFGNVLTRDQFDDAGSAQLAQFQREPKFNLRPGDFLSLEVEADPSFSPDLYKIHWSTTQGDPINSEGNRLEIHIQNGHVNEAYVIQCSIKTHNSWHRLQYGQDDLLLIYYKVLPPI